MRQLIIARKDLQMSPGKLAAQCCHASLAFLTDPIGMGQGVEPIEKDGEITGYRAEIMLESRERSPTPVKMEYPPCSVAMLRINS